MKKYIFYNSIETLSLKECILGYEIININLLNLESKNKIIDLKQFNIIKNREIYFYSSSVENIKKIHELNMKAHYCFVNQDIFNIQAWNFLKEQKDIEIFWVITENLKEEDVIKYIKIFSKYNLPICFYVSGLLFKNSYDYDLNSNMKLIKEINKKWVNPLYEKEMSLVNLVYEGNFYLEDVENKEKVLLMGLFGDIVVEENELEDISNKNLLKVKMCRKCEHFDACNSRNMGVFFSKLNYWDCLGFKILDPNT